MQQRRTPSQRIALILSLSVVFLCVGLYVLGRLTPDKREPIDYDAIFATVDALTPSVASSTKITIRYYASPAPANPYGFDFNVQDGFWIEFPPKDFCNHFDCTDTFWQENGYVVQCNDGKFSKSGSEENECAGHGGWKQMLYRHDE